MATVTIRIDKEWFEKNKQTLLDAYNKEFAHDDPEVKDSTYQFEGELTNDDFQIDGGELQTGYSEKDYNVTVWIDHKLVLSDMKQMGSMVLERFNKFLEVVSNLK